MTSLSGRSYGVASSDDGQFDEFSRLRGRFVSLTKVIHFFCCFLLKRGLWKPQSAALFALTGFQESV